jgi:hypothetical protein
MWMGLAGLAFLLVVWAVLDTLLPPFVLVIGH